MAENAYDGVGEERDGAPETEQPAAERGPGDADGRHARLLGAGGARQLDRGNDRAQRASRGGSEERRADALDEGHDRDPPERDSVEQGRGREPGDRERPHAVGRDHHQLAVVAVGRDPREQAEERERHNPRERDEAGLRRRLRQRQHEQRVGDRRRPAASRGQ
jgi:hypothetical protein